MPESDAAITVALGLFPAVIAAGLRQLLSRQGFEIAGANLSVPELETSLARHEIQVVLLYEVGDCDVAVLSRLRLTGGDTRILIFTYQSSRTRSLRLLEMGATACIPISASESQIAEAVRLTANGPFLLGASPGGFGDSETPAGSLLLTERERSVLRLLSAGWSNAQIALELKISVETARSHAAHIYRKLEVRGRRDLMADGAVWAASGSGELSVYGR